MYFYSDTAVRGDIKIDVWKMNGSAAYLRHYDNLLFLDFMAKNGTFQERQAVEKEIMICHRKLKFWENHPNYVAEVVQRGKEKANKDWNSRRAAA